MSNTLIINTSCDNKKEREYIISVFFKHFLNIDFKIVYSDAVEDYQINLQNGKFIKIKDALFKKNKNNLSYLDINSFPKTISKLKTVCYKKDVTILYGTNKIEISNTNITLEADIFASAFFMLTRWEEYINKKRDQHNRFPATESVAFKNNFLDKPIVNEYIELLWNMLAYLGYKGKRKKRKFEMTVTHDVDLPRLWWNGKDFIKSIGGALLKRKNISEFFSLLKFKLKGKDPFNTFNHLMQITEENNIKSHFFFMSGGTSNKDNFYKIDHPIVLKLMQEINSRGHKIGFHPSYNAYSDSAQFKKELNTLNTLSPQNIKTGREHFLRFEVPTTWQIWEDNQMEWDSTMSYHDIPGFRCGVCYEFPVFNILTRKQLQLLEKPLIVMEGSFITYQDKLPEIMHKDIQNLINKVKEFNGNFVFLWHNSAFNIGNSKQYQHLYSKIVKNNC